MSPRPAATRSDATARLFLDAAAQLIDASLSPAGAALPPRLRSIRFPAALDWLRVEDVVRLVEQRPGGSRRAFHQRWPTKEEFINDAVLYTVAFRDKPEGEFDPFIGRLPSLASIRFGDALVSLAVEWLRYAEASPRTYLMMHLGGLLDRHPELLAGYLDVWIPSREPFVVGFRALLASLGFALRHGWTVERFDRALQAIYDGFALQGRLQPDDLVPDQWGHADLFAETVAAFTLGVLSTSTDNATSARDALNSLRRDGTGHM